MWRVWMRRRGEVTWTNMSDLLGTDWVAAIPNAGIGTPDGPVRQFTIHFIRQSDGRSLAPGISGDPFNQVSGTFKPFIHPDTEVQVDAANLVKTAGDETAVWRRIHEGVIFRDEWPGEDVVITCNSLDFIVEDTDIEEEEARGEADPGTPMAEEDQGLIDRWMDDPVTLHAPDGSGIGIGPYKPAIGKLGAQIRALAGRIAWDARYYFDNITSTFRYTLYEPPRDKTTPDIILSPEHVREVSELGEDSDSIRNDFVYIFIDEAGRQVTRTYRTVYPEGSPSYRRRWMRIVDTEVVKTVEQADAILLSASNDLSKPLAQKRVKINYNPYLQIHDVLEFAPDDIRFDTSTIWAVVGGSHTVNTDDRYTEVDLRGGGPVGQYYAWRLREAGSVPDDIDQRSLYDVWVGEPSEDGSLLTTWKRMPLVTSVRGAAAVFPLPERSDHMVQLLGGVDSDDVTWPSQLALLPTNSLRIPPAPQGYYSLAYVQPYDSLLRQGRPWVKIMHGTPPELRVQEMRFPENAAGTQATVHLEMVDPRAVLTGINVYLTYPGAAETGPFAATLVAPLVWEYGPFNLHPDHGVFVRLEGTRNDGWPAWASGPHLVDTNKVPSKPDVRLILGSGAARTAYVDSPDTDAVGQYYRLVTGGIEGPIVPITPRSSDPRYGSFGITALEGVQLWYNVYAVNAAGVASVDYFDLRVDPYIPLGDYGGPSLDVQAVAGVSNYTIYWGGDNVTVSINGGTFGAPPASPITVARPAAGASPVDYTFRAERNGVPLTNLVSVIPLDSDTVTPDLSVTQTAANNATQSFTASATNPRTSAVLAVTVRLTGCTGTNNGSPLPADTDQTVAGAIVVTRPAFGLGNGSAKFSATIAGGGREEIAHTIPAVQQDTRGPSITVTPGTPTLTAIPISWVASADTSVSITVVGTGVSYSVGSATSTSGTLSAVRPYPGSAPGMVTFTATRDGIISTVPIPIQPVIPPSVLTANLSVDDTGVAGDDVYSLIVTGTSMAGLDLDVDYYKAGVLVSSQTYALTDNETETVGWTHVGAGDGVAQIHHAIAQLYDSGTGDNHGAPVPSRKVPSIV